MMIKGLVIFALALLVGCASSAGSAPTATGTATGTETTTSVPRRWGAPVVATAKEEKPAARKEPTMPELCARGVGNACARLAASAATSEEAARLHGQACDYGVAASCYAVAGFAEQGGDAARALTLDKQACDHGIPGACTDEGRLLEAAHGAPADVTAAYEKGCTGDDPGACFNLAIFLRMQNPVDRARVTSLADKACQGAVARACLFGGEEALASDPARAAELFKRACDGGEKDGCTLAAAKDPKEAARLRVDLDCQTGDQTSCYNEAVGLEKRDAKAAAELYRHACPAVPVACTNLGRLHQHGLGMKPDVRRARELYRQACDAGEVIGCENHGEMAVADRDLPTALADFKRACDGGDKDACKRRAEIAAKAKR